MQDWVKKILSPFKKNKTETEELSTSGSFSSWESMNPDEIPEKASRSGAQKTFMNVGILLGVFLSIMLIQFAVQKFLNVSSKQKTADNTPEKNESSSVSSVESLPAPTLPPPTEAPAPEAAPLASATAPIPQSAQPSAEVAASNENLASTQPTYNYIPQYNEQGEEVLPIFEEKMVAAAPSPEAAPTSAAVENLDPAVAQVKAMYPENPTEEALPILQENTDTAPTPSVDTSVAANTGAEAYVPQVNEQGEEVLPILEEKPASEVVAGGAPAQPESAAPNTTVVILNDNNQPTAEAAPATSTPSTTTTENAPSTAVAENVPTPAPEAAPAPSAVPAPVEAQTMSPAPAAAPVVVASAPAPRARRAAPVTQTSETESPAWLAKQNAATRMVLAEKAQKTKNVKTTVVKSATPIEVTPAALEKQKQMEAKVPGFVPEENQSIASVGRL